MIVELHNTTKIVDINGVPARVWEGHTANGVPVVALITRIAAERYADLEEFDRDLEQATPPSPDVAAWPARMVID